MCVEEPRVFHGNVGMESVKAAPKNAYCCSSLDNYDAT